MYKYFISLLLIVFSCSTFAHEMTPTYPKWKYAYMDDLLVTRMEIFNKRSDVEYYELGVFDKDWRPIPFVSQYTILNIPYLERVEVDVYIREIDKFNAEYICSRSKMKTEDLRSSSISSKICSRFKHE